MSKEGDKATVFRTTKVRTRLRDDNSWLQRSSEPEQEKSGEKPWLAEVRASRVNGAPVETSPVSSPTKPTPAPVNSETQKPPTSGFMIRGVFTKLDKSDPTPSSPSANGTSGTTQFIKKPSETYKKIAPYTVKPSLDNQGSQLSPEEQEKRTEAASNVLRKTAPQRRSYVLSAAKKYESKADAPDTPPVNNNLAFVAKRVEITDDDENAATPAPAIPPRTPVTPNTPVTSAPLPKPRKQADTSVKTPVDVAAIKPEAPKVEEKVTIPEPFKKEPVLPSVIKPVDPKVEEKVAAPVPAKEEPLPLPVIKPALPQPVKGDSTAVSFVPEVPKVEEDVVVPQPAKQDQTPVSEVESVVPKVEKKVVVPEPAKQEKTLVSVVESVVPKVEEKVVVPEPSKQDQTPVSGVESVVPKVEEETVIPEPTKQVHDLVSVFESVAAKVEKEDDIPKPAKKDQTLVPLVESVVPKVEEKVVVPEPAKKEESLVELVVPKVEEKVVVPEPTKQDKTPVSEVELVAPKVKEETVIPEPTKQVHDLVSVFESVASKAEEEVVVPEPAKKDPAPVSVPEKDPFAGMKPGCTKVDTPLPVLLTQEIEAVSTEPEAEYAKPAGQDETPLVDLTTESTTPLSPILVSPPAVPLSPTPVSPTKAPVVPLSPTPVSPTKAPVVPLSPTPVSPTKAPVVPLSPTPVSPTKAPVVPLSLTPVSPTKAPVVPLSPTPVSPTKAPVVPLSPTPVSPTKAPVVPLSLTQESPIKAPVVPLSPIPVSPTKAPVVPLSPTPVSPTKAPVAPLSPTQEFPIKAPVVPLSPIPVSPTKAPVAPLSPTQESPTKAPVVPLSPTQVSPTPAPALPKSPPPVSLTSVSPDPLSSTLVSSVKEILVKTEPEPVPEPEPSPKTSSDVDTLRTLSDTLISFNTSSASVKDDEPELAQEEGGSVDSHAAEDGEEEPAPEKSNSIPITDDLLPLTGPEEPSEPVPPSPRRWNQDLLSGLDRESSPAKSSDTVDLLKNDVILRQIEERSLSTQPEEEKATDETAKETQSSTETITVTTKTVIITDKSEEDAADPWSSHVRTSTVTTTSSSADPFDPYPIGTTSPNSSSDLLKPRTDISINRVSTTTVESQDPSPDTYLNRSSWRTRADDPISTSTETTSSWRTRADDPISTSTETISSWRTRADDPISTSTETTSTRRTWTRTWDTSTTYTDRSEDTKPAGQAEDQNMMVMFERKSKENDSPWDRWTSPTVYTITSSGQDDDEEEESYEDTQTQTVTTITTVREIHREPEPVMDRYDTYSRTVIEEERRSPTPEPETKKGFVFVKEYVNASEMSLHNARDTTDGGLDYITSRSADYSYSSPFSSSPSSSCNYCGEQVGNDAKISIEHLNINCHPACFKCGVCGKPMGDLLFSMFLHEGKVHCESCYSKALD